MRVPTIARRKTRQRLAAVGLLAAALLANGDALLAQPSDEAVTPLRFEVSFPRDTSGRDHGARFRHGVPDPVS